MEMEPEAPKGPRVIGFAATWAAVITVTCVLVGQTAAQYAGLLSPSTGSELASAGAAKSAPPNFSAIDYSSTGAVKGETIVINPCTGAQTTP